MQKTDFIEEAAKFGDEVGRLDKALSRFGIGASRAAAEGFALPDDAENILIAFQEARYRAREGKKLVQPPHKVQISKLRQFLKLGDQFGSDGVERLEWLARQDFFYDTKGGAYEALLTVARASIKAGNLLSESEIKAIFNTTEVT